jgi:hypothetical protein
MPTETVGGVSDGDRISSAPTVADRVASYNAGFPPLLGGMRCCPPALPKVSWSV